MKITIELNDNEFADQLVLESLKENLHDIEHNNFPFVHPDDIKFEKKIIKSLKVLIMYYGG